MGWIHATQGFTLVELLVTTVIGALMLLGGTYLVVSHLRSTGLQAVAHRLQTDFGRLSNLIATEVAEGTELDYDVATTGCTNNGVVSAFSITVPLLVAAETGSTSTVRTIFYYELDNNLWRCGPAIKADGTLNKDETADGIVITNATLVPDNDVSNEQQMKYRVFLTDPTTGVSFDSAVTPGWLFARTKAFQIE